MCSILSKVCTTFLRIFQLLFAACVLGFAVNAVRWQYYAQVPATNGFCVFAGAFACLAALLGFGAICKDSTLGVAAHVFDWLATVFLLCGGIAMAVGLHGTNCSAGTHFSTWHNKLISGGCVIRARLDRYQCGFFHISDVEHRCRLATAETVLLFFAMLASLAMTVHGAHAARSRKKGVSIA